MTTVLVTVSNALFAESRERLVASARHHGIGAVHAHDFDELRQKHSFFANHEEIFANPRGLGFWLWKPFVIQMTLAGLAEGEVLVYMDSGVEITGDLTPLVDICRADGPVLLFGNGSDTNARWTRRDCFVEMECDLPEFWRGPHCDASIVLARKSPPATAFVDEWLALCCNPAILTDAPNKNGLPELPEFQDHRHDQSVLSLLAQKHRIALHRIPSQFGNHYKMYGQRVPGEFNCMSQWDQTQIDYYAAVPYHNSPYGQLVNHHRRKVLPPEPPAPTPPLLHRRILGRLKRLVASGETQ